jgi:hypothetical protein
MAIAEALEGSLGPVWFHYDLRNDVLYLRLLHRREQEAHGEENDEGLIVLRSLVDDAVVGMTVVNWWKRFGQGELPDSMSQVVAGIEPWAKRSAAAA